MAKNNSRLKVKYESEIASKLAKEFGIKNKMAIPKVTKVVVNTGIGEAVKNKEIVKKMSADLANITGQKPSMRRARVSAASFGLRQGTVVGLAVTVRGDRIYDFLDKTFSVVLPRVRDFRGLPLKGFDKAGNYTFGVVDHTIFPEVDLAKSTPHGLQITIVTSVGDKEQSERLLELLGAPFAKEQEK